LGASLCGYRPVVDFMLLAVDQIVTQAAKWRSMFGGQVSAPVTIRGIINRGGEQGAQHSQALHSWFAHIPGLRVVMPATARDARDLLIASVLSDDPVLYLDDRWLYELEEELPPPGPVSLAEQGPVVRRPGKDITLVGCSFAAHQVSLAAAELAKEGVDAEVIDLRVLNPLDCSVVVSSVAKTNRLLVADGDWRSCGLAGEVIASVVERRAPTAPNLRAARVTHPDAPAPTSKPLEQAFYFGVSDIVREARRLLA
jgi:pyruvate dehydrogenase E1 component beta subunit